MIKRPISSQFRDPVMQGIKTTTIRDKPWPIGVPIMLYSWIGTPYRSKQSDLTEIIVTGYWTICITQRIDGTMRYTCGREKSQPIWQTEGFSSQQEMDDWFRPLIESGKMEEKVLMRFTRLITNV